MAAPADVLSSMIMKCHLRAFLLLFATAVSFMNMEAQAKPAFDDIVVIGDSLSDNGNAGRFSNGSVWVEYLAERLGLSLTPSRAGGGNFAIGGALLDARSGGTSLRAQATAYLQAPQRRGRVLYIVYGGGNDLLAAVGNPRPQAVVETAIASLRSIVLDLANQGATDILAPNLPGLGIAPAVRSYGRQAIEAADRLAQHFNSVLEQALSGLPSLGGLRLYRLDVWQMAERVRSDPAASGFVDITSPCNQHRRCDGHLFWDGIHPTTEAHRRLGDAAADLLVTP